ncbi:MAG TPA: hypothetical protein PKL02_07385 [Rectinema sp.]|nr:hypothetical protein [Rectinema sp.]
MSTITPYHAKYFAWDLTRHAPQGLDCLSMSLFDAKVDLNPHQIEAVLFALRSPLSKSAGFFEAGNFHPDFMLWLVDADGRQHVRFVDPKSVRQMGFEDPQIDFYKNIKDIENRLADPDLTLDSYILSDTSSMDMMLHWNVNKTTMLAHHVVFLDEDKGHYLETILADNAENHSQQKIKEPT